MLRFTAMFFALALLATACGDSDSGTTTQAETGAEESTATTASPAGGVSQEAAEEAVAATTTTAAAETDTTEATEEEADPYAYPFEDPATMDELEANWAVDRQRIVDGIVAGGYGVGGDNVLTGPGGFMLDLNSCPADWDDGQGVTDSSVLFGHTTALSGQLAAYGVIAEGWQAYFTYVNEKFGGIGGRELDLIIKDDEYVVTNSIENVNEMLELDKPFSIVTLGSPPSLANYDTLNEACVPQAFVMTGHPAWGDPENHPWTTSSIMSYATEAILWGTWIKENLSDQLPVKVAGLVMNNDFGLAYEFGMQDYADANPDIISEFVPIRHDPAAATLTNELTTIAAEEPDVFISMTAGNACVQAVLEAARSGLAESASALFYPSVCKAIQAYVTPTEGAAEGWYIVGGGAKDFADPQYADEPYVAFYHEELGRQGLDSNISLYATGWGLFGFGLVEALRVAEDLPGGLNRTNYILAVRSLDLNHPGLLEGIKYHQNGVDDAYIIEGSDFSQFDVASGSWIVASILDLDGNSANCAFDLDAGACA